MSTTSLFFMPHMTPLRVLVLGSSGRVGMMLRHFWAQNTELLRSANTEFVFQSRNALLSRPDDLLWNLHDPLPKAVIDAAPFDCMIVLSGVVPRPDADFTLNTDIGTACVAAAAQLGISHILLASTSAVYGTYSNMPFTETDPLRPLTDYGRSKRDMEEVCRTLAKAADIALCCLRMGNVAGADALLANGAKLPPGEKLRLEVFRDGGTPVRSYIGPHSLANVMLSLIHKRTQLPNILNIAAPRPVTMHALAQAAGIPLELHHTDDNAHQRVTLACDALTALHPFTPTEDNPDEIVHQWRLISEQGQRSQVHN